MRPSNRIEAQRLVELIAAGTASRSDVVALLMYLREHLDNRDPVKDIAHCIAHEERDTGIAFKYIERFMDELIAIVQSGGPLHVTVLFPLNEVIDHLVDDLQRQGLVVQPEAFHAQAALLQKHLGDTLEGVTLKLPNPHVVGCRFATAAAHPHPTFNVRFQGLEHAPVLPIHANVELAFPVFVG